MVVLLVLASEGYYTIANYISLLDDNGQKRFTSITYYGEIQNNNQNMDPTSFPILKIQVSMDGYNFFSVGDAATFNIMLYTTNLQFVLKLRNISANYVRLYVERGNVDFRHMFAILSKI